MAVITIVGLGPGNPAKLTREAMQELAIKRPVYFRTFKHPAARYYRSIIRGARSFDSLYKKGKDFDGVYRAMATRLVSTALQDSDICYVVPGHPLVGEAVVGFLRKIAPRKGIRLKIIDGVSFLEPLLEEVRIDLLDGVTVLDALVVDRVKEPSPFHLILAQVYNRSIASRVKLKLMELYPDNYPVTVVRAAGTPEVYSRKSRLYELDRFNDFDHSTTIYLSPFRGGRIGELVEIMARLRSPEGCPWDRKQTHTSLRQYLVEEAYEVVAAIDQEDEQALVDELGDLLLQVVFHSQIGHEEGRFNLSEVINAISTKLIRRHPHVFGARKAKDADAVKVLWEEIKAGERKDKKQGILIPVDQALPALLKAYKLQKKAAELGFDWPALDGPMAKASEELKELEEAIKSGDHSAVEEEVGDFLFTIVNIARFLKVNPELALGRTIAKFLDRFSYVQAQVEKTGKPFGAFTLDQLDRWWDEAKKIKELSTKRRIIGDDRE